MVFTGMIFQFNSEEGRGLIMLSDGEQREFCTNDWIDTENMPAVGQKISYENGNNRIQIKVANEEDKIVVSSDEEKKSDPEEDNETDLIPPQFTKVEDYINYYKDMGFKLVKDSGDDELRTVTLRLYTVTDYGEATIKQDGSKISVTQVLNGKTVVST